MGLAFCEHGYMKDCPHGCADVMNGFPSISGDTCPCLGPASLVPKGRKEKDVRWMVNPRTGHREKMYKNHGLGEWCSGVKDTEKVCNEKGLAIIG